MNATATKTTKSTDDFLKALYLLQHDGERVQTNTLADALSIKAPSVTDMARRLEAAGLVDYQKYKGMRVTDEGRAIALRLLRRHRLIELFLMRELGYALHEVHAEAEVLEHAVSDRFIEALAHRLGDPDFDPHGDPIPTREGVVTARDLTPLTELPPRTPAVVARLRADDPALLQHLIERGFVLGEHVEVVAADPFDGPLTVTVAGAQRVLGHTAATCVDVEAVG